MIKSSVKSNSAIMDGTLFDLTIELNTIIDHTLRVQPDMLLAILTEWSDKIQEQKVQNKTVYNAVLHVTQHYMKDYDVEVADHD